MKTIIHGLLFLFSSFFLFAGTAFGQPTIGSTIVLQGDNTRYVTVNSGSELVVSENSPSNAENFVIVDAGNSKVAFQAENGKFVTITSTERVQATANSLGADEMFTIENIPTGGFSIKANNGKYIIAAYSAGAMLLAGSDAPKKFMYQAVSALPIGSTIVLQGDNTRYVTVTSGSDLSVNENSKSNAENFVVFDAGNGKIAFQAENGKFVTITSRGRVQPTANRIEADEMFTVENLPTGGFSMKANNGKYLIAAYSSGGVVLASFDTPKKFMYQTL